MLSRFSSTALSGTSTERNTSMSSTNDMPSTARMNTGSRSLTRTPTSAKFAVCPPTWARAGLSASAAGNTSVRSRSIVSWVASPAAGRRVGDDRADVAADRRAARRRRSPGRARSPPRAARTASSPASATATTSGPLRPGPKPWATRSYAWRWVKLGGSAPSSGMPTRSASTGAARATSTAVTPDQVDAGVAGDVPGPPRPARARRVDGRRPTTRRPGDGQQGGQQRHRRDHHDEDDHRDGDAARRHERHLRDRQPQDRDDDDPAGEHHGPAGVAIDRAIESWTVSPRASCSRCRVMTNSA